MAFRSIRLTFFIFLIWFSCGSETNKGTNILNELEKKQSLTQKNKDTKPEKVNQITLPEGFYREKADSLSFEFYLRNLDLNTSNNNIYSFNGSIISTGGYHFAIINLDVGTQDLQQCADAIIRLRAEYLYQQKQYQKIHFNFLSDGKARFYNDYSKGDRTYKKFRKYLDYIFSYANTGSLINEMQAVENFTDMRIGDVFIQKGNPIGHAVIVLDMAIEKVSGKKIFLLAGSFMPAQSIHILSNLNDKNLDPWYPCEFDDPLSIPVWTFYKKDLRRFK